MNTDLTGPFKVPEPPKLSDEMKKAQDLLAYHMKQNEGFKRQVKVLKSSLETVEFEKENYMTQIELLKGNHFDAAEETDFLKRQLQTYKDFYDPKDDPNYQEPEEESEL